MGDEGEGMGSGSRKGYGRRIENGDVKKINR